MDMKLIKGRADPIGAGPCLENSGMAAMSSEGSNPSSSAKILCRIV